MHSLIKNSLLILLGAFLTGLGIISSVLTALYLTDYFTSGLTLGVIVQIPSLLQGP
jgi:hypothetical protein